MHGESNEIPIIIPESKLPEEVQHRPEYYGDAHNLDLLVIEAKGVLDTLSGFSGTEFQRNGIIDTLLQLTREIEDFKGHTTH